MAIANALRMSVGIFALWLCTTADRLHAQADFSDVDRFAANTALHNNDLEQLCETLTGPYPAELEKARAIFVWISENIAYDCGSENRLAREPDEAGKLSVELGQLQNTLDEKELRWLELADRG